MLKDAVATADLAGFRQLVDQKKLPLQCVDAVNGWPILFYAIKYHQNTIVEYLLDRGHEDMGVSRDFASNTAVMIAAEHKNEEAIEIYLKRFPQVVDMINQKGQTALMIAASKGLRKCIEDLFALGANAGLVDEDGSTALHYAMSYGHAEASVVLIEHGQVSMHIKNNKGFTAHDYASARSFGTVATKTQIPGTVDVSKRLQYRRKKRVLTNASNKIKGTSVYAGKHTVTLIPGDGVGSEMAGSVQAIFKAANVPVEFESFDLSSYNPATDSNKLKQAMDSIKRNKIALKGILHTPVSRLGHISLNVGMRKELDIYASLSLIRNMDGKWATRQQNVDIALIRENTEGEYSGLEHAPVPGVVESLKVVTREKTERIARFAFDFALKNGRKKVTCIHKANIMKLGDGLFLRTFRDVAKEYESSGIKFEDMIVDNASMQLVAKPTQFDVI
ncbi:UNVERIFIED_CONTAM: isocitrate dehydrogenase (NAD(+)) idh1, partial [Siphonaria sp. JEL0065]